MVGNDNALGQPAGVLVPTKAKWYNNGEQELLLEVNDEGRPTNSDYETWNRGKLKGNHPRVLQIRKEREESETK